MEKKCIRCGHIRKNNDYSPEYECPKCGVIYEKAEAAAMRVMDSLAINQEINTAIEAEDEKTTIQDKSENLKLDPNKRILCSDESCIGILNESYRCNVCGKTPDEIKYSKNDIDEENLLQDVNESDGEVVLIINNKSHPRIGLCFVWGFGIVTFIMIIYFGFIEQNQTTDLFSSSDTYFSNHNASISKEKLDPNQIYRKSKGAVVVVKCGGYLGSGFIISPDGYIITNYHVPSPEIFDRYSPR